MLKEESVMETGDTTPSEAVKEVIEAGIFYGRIKSKTHPKMKPNIFGNRAGVEIIDPSQIVATVEAAAEALTNVVAKNGTVLIVATQPAAASVLALSRGPLFPVVARRWIGGTLTNFETIVKRIEYFKKLKADKASGELSKYTKKERLTMDRDIRRYEELLGGIESLAKLPNMLLMVDPIVHRTAVREARKMKIPVIALMNTDSNPQSLDFPVFGNTLARKSIDWFAEKMSAAIDAGVREAQLVKKEAVAESDNAGSGE